MPVTTLPVVTRVGRPSVLTEQLLDNIALLVAEGHYIVTACQALGVPRRNYYNWLKQGEADEEQGLDTLASKFWHTLKTAEAQGEITNGRKWLEGKMNWAAYATWNERKAPDRWGKRNEDVSTPRVVVQIGVRDGDVQVSLGESASGQHTIAASDVRLLSADSRQLTESVAVKPEPRR